jgi:hypothetical protein
MTPGTGHDARQERVFESNRDHDGPMLLSLFALHDPVAAKGKCWGRALCIS